MNNEEKILHLLEKQGEMIGQMNGRLERVEAAQIEQGQRLVEQGQRLERLEATQAEQGDLLKVLDERSLRSAVLLEADVSRDLNRLYEGHGAIMNRLDKLAARSRVEELEGDVSMLKDSVKLLRIEVNELKKAQ